MAKPDGAVQQLSSKTARPFFQLVASRLEANVENEFVRCFGMGQERMNNPLPPVDDEGGEDETDEDIEPVDVVIPKRVEERKGMLRNLLSKLCGMFYVDLFPFLTMQYSKSTSQAQGESRQEVPVG